MFVKGFDIYFMEKCNHWIKMVGKQSTNVLNKVDKTLF